MGTEHEVKVAFQIKQGRYGLLNEYTGKITIWGENEIRAFADFIPKYVPNGMKV